MCLMLENNIDEILKGVYIYIYIYKKFIREATESAQPDQSAQLDQILCI